MQNPASNAEKLNQVISDNLFPEVQHVSDVKQVLEQMKEVGQNYQEWQIKAMILLDTLGNNDYIHPDGSPYKDIIKTVDDAREKVVDPDYFIDTIEALIPKPPKPIVMAEKSAGKER